MHFVVIASPRTGSTHLTSALNMRDDILCNGEVLHQKNNKVLVRWPKSEKTGEVKRELIELRNRDPNAFLKLILDHDCGRSHVGFKILPKHNDELLDKIVEDRSIRKIVLFRQNVLAAYSSSRIAHETRKRHGKAARADRPLVPFDESRFRSYCERYLAFYKGIFERLNSTGQRFHIVYYEGINDPILFDNLLAFLGAKRGVSAVTSRSAKGNTPDILARFSNRTSVEEFLSHNGLIGWSYESEISFDPLRLDRARIGDDSCSQTESIAASLD